MKSEDVVDSIINWWECLKKKFKKKKKKFN